MNSINIVIPAAGEATRLKPLTSNCSKAMIRIHGKPAIEYIIDSVYKNSTDVEEIIIVDGKHNDIREWLRKKHEENRYVDVSCVKQGSLNGPRDAIRVGIESLKNKSLPLVVWLGDAIILEENMSFGKDFLLTKEVDDHFLWCMWDGKEFFNKPQHTVQNGVALVGLYSFSDGIAAEYAFSTSKEYDISFALEKYSRSTSNEFSRVSTNKWYDIGDISSYHKTCAEFLTFKARDFNSFTYDPDLNVVTKIPKYSNEFAVQTINNEKIWYANLTPKQRMFVPKILDNDYGLSLSYESGTLLSDLFIHEDISNSTIDYLIEKVVVAIKNHFHTAPDANFLEIFAKNANIMWNRKTFERLKSIKGFVDNVFVFKTYIDIANECFDKAKPVRTMHGDLHFGNILYNPFNDSITLIDPRGEYGLYKGCSGDHLYDLCKLSHDLYHGYNSLINGKPYPKYVRESFSKIIREHYPNEYKEIIDGGALLIATCIPLHYDNSKRQQKMMEYIIEYANTRNRH
jgi:glucose-1-phosphate thymidylyltransferase